MRPIASLSLDLDNKWSYMKTHGDAGWDKYPTYLDVVVPRFLKVLNERDLKMTVFIVGQDASREENFESLASISAAGHRSAITRLTTSRGCICIRSRNWSANSRRPKSTSNASPGNVPSVSEAPGLASVIFC